MVNSLELANDFGTSVTSAATPGAATGGLRFDLANKYLVDFSSTGIDCCCCGFSVDDLRLFTFSGWRGGDIELASESLV